MKILKDLFAKRDGNGDAKSPKESASRQEAILSEQAELRTWTAGEAALKKRGLRTAEKPGESHKFKNSLL